MNVNPERATLPPAPDFSGHEHFIIGYDTALMAEFAKRGNRVPLVLASVFEGNKDVVLAPVLGGGHYAMVSAPAKDFTDLKQAAAAKGCVFVQAHEGMRNVPRL